MKIDELALIESYLTLETEGPVSILKLESYEFLKFEFDYLL